MFYIIYKITNKINGKFYIGSHKTKDKNDNYMGSGTYLKRAIHKYGIKNFIKETLQECSTEEEMYQKEKQMVILCKDSYNLKYGGDGGFDFINKLGINNSANQCSLGGKAGAGTSKPWVKEKKNLERLKIIRIGNKSWTGKKHTLDQIEKIKKWHSGRHFGSNNNNFGKIWITNGIENKLIKKEETIEIGWKKGRIIIINSRDKNGRFVINNMRA